MKFVNIWRVQISRISYLDIVREKTENGDYMMFALNARVTMFFLCGCYSYSIIV